MAADILARHMRQRGEEVFFLTGTDEFGEPVAQQAEREGVTPRELGDRQAPRFKEMAREGRRVERLLHPHHRRGPHEAGRRRSSSASTTTGTSTRAPTRAGTARAAPTSRPSPSWAPGNTCPIHKIELTREQQENWFFRLSAFQEPLERLYEERPDFVIPDFRRNEALAFIRQGLQDVSLSRPTLKWGVPVPWDPDQVIYVWFDALLNYYTALSYAREGEDLTDRFWPAFHILAKDILKFHAVYWPAFLMAAGIEPPRAHVHPRLPADGRAQDVEVARQRARPVRGDRSVRRRRAALLLLPRGQLRPGRLGLRRPASRPATRPSWRTTSGTSRAARWR